MKRVFALLFFAVTFAVMTNAQRYGNSTCGLIPGPCMERYARQAFAPVDYMINNYGYGYSGYGYGGYGYGYGNGRIGTSAIVGGVAGAITGGLVAAVVSHRSDNRVYAVAPDGGQYYAAAPQRQVVLAAPKPQKPLDCRKPRGKRGRNEAACAVAEQEAAIQRQDTERQACLDQLASSSWRLRNGSDRFTFYPTVNSQPLMICGEPVVLRPSQTIRIFPPAGQIGGMSSGASVSGERVEFTAKVRPVNQPGFIGFVLLAPGASEGGN